jgi:predicted RecA/RadA family phage recombinase
MAVRAIRMDASDNVAVVTADVKAGEAVHLDDGTEVRAAEDVPRGAKVALAPIASGGAIRRYGETIGLATEDIAAGENVHTHNLGDRR